MDDLKTTVKRLEKSLCDRNKELEELRANAPQIKPCERCRALEADEKKLKQMLSIQENKNDLLPDSCHISRKK